MQVVIKIDDNLYTRLFDNSDEYVADMRRACVAIRKGTPLPKGHGRLIDADKTISKICGNSCGCHIEECGRDKPCYSVTRIIGAQTIIEAYTESEDKE